MAVADAADEADADTATARAVTDATGTMGGALGANGKRPEAAAAASSVHTQLAILAHLTIFSFFGALARVGLSALTTYPGAPVAVPSLWPNFAGCLIMGFLVKDRVLFGGDKKKTAPLYIGLTTGFCGSFTTFSAFARDMFLALANRAAAHDDASHHRNGGYSFMALLAVILLTVVLSLGGFVVGGHLADLLAAAASGKSFPLASRRTTTTAIATPLLLVLFALGLWLGAILLVALPPDRHRGNTWRGKITFTLVFAPPGTLLRYALARALNARLPRFPLGTFAANALGVLLVAVFWDLAHAPRGGVVGCQVLQGLQDGFCGCLTTVSAWATELAALAARGRRRDAYIYGTASVLGALGLVVVIMGSLLWTDGFAPLQCAT